MSLILPNLKYTKEHEWARLENDILVVGITDFAQSSLGDIVFVELPEVGRELKAGQTFGVVESIKSVSDLYSPVSGTVIEKNTDTENTPELINQNPFEHWLIKIKLNNSSEVNSLLDAEQYKNHCASSH